MFWLNRYLIFRYEPNSTGLADRNTIHTLGVSEWWETVTCAHIRCIIYTYNKAIQHERASNAALGEWNTINAYKSSFLICAHITWFHSNHSIFNFNLNLWRLIKSEHSQLDFAARWQYMIALLFGKLVQILSVYL